MTETYILGNVGENKAQIGTNTMINTSGVGNSAFGFGVFTSLTTGVENSGFGFDIASGVSANPSRCTAHGTQAIKAITTATDASAFGYQALTNLTTGNNNTSFGYLSGATVVSGLNNTLFGANSDVINATVSDSIAVGSNSVGADRSISVGHGAQCLDTSPNSNCIIIGTDTSAGEGSSETVVVGAFAGNIGPLVSSTIMGAYSCPDRASLFTNNTVIGWVSGEDQFVVEDTVSVGEECGRGDGARNTGVGFQALGSPDSVNPKYDNVGVGYQAGNTLNGTGNTCIGFTSGTELDSVDGCTAFGSNAISNVSSGGAGSVANGTDTGLTGTGGFTAGSSLILVRVAPTQTGNTTDISGGTAATGGAGEIFFISKIADGTATTPEASILDFTGATTAGLDGKYFLISSPTTDYYVWYDIDNASIDPAVPGRTGIEVNRSSGASSSSIANATSFALRNYVPPGAHQFSSEQEFRTLYNNNVVLRVVNNVAGDVTDIAPGTATGVGKLTGVVKIADGGASGEVAVIDCSGANTNIISGSYFLISTTTTDYYVWYNNGTATDPGPPGLNLPALVGRTGVEITFNRADANTGFGYRAMYGNNGIAPEQMFRDSVGIGANAGSAMDTGANQNTLIGANAATTLSSGSNNLLIGQGSTITVTTSNETVGIGESTTVSLTGTSFGQGSTASAAGSVAIGQGASATGVNSCQIGPAAVSTGATATLNYRTQIVADETWIGGGSSSVIIDNNGDIIRGTGSLLEVETTDDTATAIETYTMADNTSRQIEALVMGRRTGGFAGTPDDTTSMRIDAVVTRTGAALAINRVIEVQLQDPIFSSIITNTVSGPALNIDPGTAVGGVGELSSVSTIVEGGVPRNEVSLIDFYKTKHAAFYPGRYFLISSTTVDYYVWWSSGATTDPGTFQAELMGRTGIMVLVAGSDDPLTLIQKTAAAINGVGGAGVVFNVPVHPTSTISEIVYSAGTIDTDNIEPGTATTGSAGELNAVFTHREGGSLNEKSVIDCFGATPAGLDGKWFLINGATGYYAWYRVDGVTVDPGLSSARLAGRTSIPIDIASGDSDVVIATKTSSEINIVPGFDSTGSAILITNVATGATVLPFAKSTSFWNPLSGPFPYALLHTAGSVGVAQEVVISTAGATGTAMDVIFGAPFNTGRWFQISTTAITYYFWYNYLGTDADPTPGGTGVMISLVAADNEISIAAKTIAAINGVAGGTAFTATPFIEMLSVTNTVSGPASDISAGTNGTAVGLSRINSLSTMVDGTSTTTAEISSFDSKDATPAGLDGKYFLISSNTTDYYVWYDVDASSVDPAPLGATAIPVSLVTLPTPDDATDIATKTAAAINAVGGAGVTFTSTTQSLWDIDIVANGTDAELQVTGNVGTDITWKGFTRNFVV